MLLMCSSVHASKLTRAFDALEIYNYFEAKRLFEKSIKKHPVPACYGLSIIYGRKDNPFSNLDSAHTMIVRSLEAYPSLKLKTKEKYSSKLKLDSMDLVQQRTLITSLYFERSIETHSVYGYQDFIDKNPWSPLKDSATYLRDELAFMQAKEGGKSADYLNYVNEFPQSQNSKQALSLYHEALYAEETYSNNYVDYLNFVRKYPDSPYRNQAEDKIYEMATQTGTVDAYRNFIVENPDNRNVTDAWKHLFNAKMKEGYSAEAIEAFERDFPDYPFKSDLLIEKNMADKLLFPFKNNGKWGAIDKFGTTIIPERFEQIDWFSEGLAVFRDGDKYGYINKMGKVAIPAQYNDALSFNEGYALVELDDKWGMIDRNGDLIVPIQYEELGVLKDGLAYFIEEDQYGYFDEKGNVRIPPQFDEAYDFEDGFAVVSKNDFYGVIDEFATTYLPYQFEELFPLKNKLFLAKFKDYWGILSIEKDTIVSFEYDYIGTESEGWRIVEIEDEYNYVNANGKLLSVEWFETYPEYRAFAQFQNGHAKIMKDIQMFLMDTVGNMLYKKGLQDVGGYADFVAFKKNDLWGYKTNKGTEIIKPEYDFAESFRKDVAIVMKDPFFGVINTKNEAIIPLLQESITFLSDSVLIVKRMGRYGLLSVKGDTLVNVSQKKIEPISDKIVRIYSDQEVFYYHLENKRYIRREE